MIEVEGKVLTTVDEVVRWFIEASTSRRGVAPYHDDVGQTLSEKPYSDALAEVVVRAFDEGTAPARAAMCGYLKYRPVVAPVLQNAWMRWVSPPAPWLDDVGSTGGGPLGAKLSYAAEACGVVDNPALADAFVKIADRYGTRALWTLSIAQADVSARGLEALREGFDRGVKITPGDASMIGWRWAKYAPNLLAAVGVLLSGHNEDVRNAFLREAKKQLDAEQAAAVEAALGL